MAIRKVVRDAREFMIEHDLSGWLLYDYRDMNPIFWDTVGFIPNVTRPCWLWIPSHDEPKLLVSYVDSGRFSELGIETMRFVSRSEMIRELRGLLRGSTRIAMEYSPMVELPRVSKIDGGTLELVRELGPEIVSSADLVQYSTQRWEHPQLQSHVVAADKLYTIVHETFGYIGEELKSGVTEYQVADFIRDRLAKEGLEATDGPVVAVNEHSSDPHFDPSINSSNKIMHGDWLLIDLWGRLKEQSSMFADITWTAFVGDDPSREHREVFDTVIGARDAALSQIETAFSSEQELRGMDVDKVARDYISTAGFGDYFNHRLGHSLGREVHGNAVNLDSWETQDTRMLIPGIAVTIEPGIYLPEFGVRSEIDVYIAETGPHVTTEMQRSIILIDG